MPKFSFWRRYPYPLLPLILPIVRILLGISSSASRDTEPIVNHIAPPPRVLNAEHIPPNSPFVLVVNHYDHPNLGAWWGIMVLMRAVAARRTREPRDIRFAMAREWWYPNGFGRWIKQPITQWFFGQIAKTYGTITLPPAMEQFRGEATTTVRRALTLTRGENPQLVGIAPEGRTGPNLTLCEPPRGAGLFLMLLTHNRVPCLPAGIFEDDAGAITVRFGAPFELHVPRELPRDERDRLAAQQVMVAIGKLLPERMRGVYRGEISTHAS